MLRMGDKKNLPNLALGVGASRCTLIRRERSNLGYCSAPSARYMLGARG